MMMSGLRSGCHCQLEQFLRYCVGDCAMERWWKRRREGAVGHHGSRLVQDMKDHA
jgi:hypothetical protein